MLISRKMMLNNNSITCPPSNKKHCELLYRTGQIICHRELWNKTKGRYNTGTPNSNGSLHVRSQSFNLYSMQICFYQRTHKHRRKEVVFADDFTVAGKARKILGYTATTWTFVWLLPQTIPIIFDCVKDQHYGKTVNVFMGSKVKLTSEGKWHLGAVIGSEAFKVPYKKSLVDNWIKQSKLLSSKVESEPLTSYSAFVGGFKEKRTYFMHLIPSLGDLLKPWEDICFNFIPATNWQGFMLGNLS